MSATKKPETGNLKLETPELRSQVSSLSPPLSPVSGLSSQPSGRSSGHTIIFTPTEVEVVRETDLLLDKAGQAPGVAEKRLRFYQHLAAVTFTELTINDVIEKQNARIRLVRCCRDILGGAAFVALTFVFVWLCLAM